MLATVTECEINQTEWNMAFALAGGGLVWEDEGLQWSWQAHDGQLMLNFPRAIDATAVRRGVEFARERDAHIVGAWLSAETDARALEAVGFERGWAPSWMAASGGRDTGRSQCDRPGRAAVLRRRVRTRWSRQDVLASPQSVGINRKS